MTGQSYRATSAWAD